jgi:hypothetical protein
MKGNNVVEFIEPAPERLNITREQWAKTPEAVRVEVLRAHQELLAGFKKHRPGAERFEEIREFHELAESQGKKLADVMRAYVSMENALRNEATREQALEALFQNMGTSSEEVAARILSEWPEDEVA